MEEKNNSAILLLHCPDKKGIVLSVTDFIFKNGGNIIELDQHIDAENDVFFMRVKFDISSFDIPKSKIGEYFETLVASKYQITFSLYVSERKPRMALFVSHLTHCLYDILGRWQSGEWDVEIPVVIGNHEKLRPIVEQFGLTYECLEITKENKKQQEQNQIDLLEKYEIDFVVLARYMQILSHRFIEKYENKIINIHHSFLPAFPGARPYHSAYDRGVKIIGTTSHYVTTELDAGPIIEQDIVRVTHKDSVEDLKRKGRDLEKVVLSRAIYHHLERKILVYNNRTIVFE